MTGRRMRPQRSFWSDDPGDPDFHVEFVVEPGARIRLQEWAPLRLAQRIRRVRPHLRAIPDGDRWRIRVTVGLSAIYQTLGHRLDPWLERLVWLEVTPEPPQEELRLDARAPFDLTLPGRDERRSPPHRRMEERATRPPGDRLC